MVGVYVRVDHMRHPHSLRLGESRVRVEVLLVRVDDRTLKIYPGEKERIIGKEPTGTILMNPPAGISTTEPFVADLNGDGVSDLLLKHVLVNPASHILELKLSK
jgi:hypothetical protein